MYTKGTCRPPSECDSYAGHAAMPGALASSVVIGSSSESGVDVVELCIATDTVCGRTHLRDHPHQPQRPGTDTPPKNVEWRRERRAVPLATMTGEQNALSLRKKVAFSAIVFVAVLLALELVARIVLAAANVDLHSQHEDLITVLGLPELNETMEFDTNLFWHLKPALRNFTVSGTIGGNAIDFHVSTHDRLRSANAIVPKTALRIIALGDSTTFGLAVDDKDTWPAVLEKLLRAEGIDVDVVNAGVPGYTAFQGYRFMHERGFSLQPDLVIVTFGFNDADSWGSRSDVETARVMELRRLERPLRQSWFYGGIRKLLLRAGAADASTEAPATPAGASDAKSTSSSSPRLAPEMFDLKMHTLARDIRAQGSEVMFVIWPDRNQIRLRRTDLWNYQEITHSRGKLDDVIVVNLIEPFIHTDAPLFADHVHANAAGCSVAAETLAPYAAKLLR